MAGTSRDLYCNTDETFASHRSNDPETEKFDRTIGIIEDVIMDEEFRLIQQAFLRKYGHEFDPNLEENKLIYTDIHREYLMMIDNFILNKIKVVQPDFNFNSFAKQLENRRNELEEEIFEFLLTFTDFLKFKQWMLDHRGSTTFDVSSCLQSTYLQNTSDSNSLSSSNASNNNSANQRQSISFDLCVTGTKIKHPEEFSKK